MSGTSARYFRDYERLADNTEADLEKRLINSLVGSREDSEGSSSPSQAYVPSTGGLCGTTEVVSSGE